MLERSTLLEAAGRYDDAGYPDDPYEEHLQALRRATAADAACAEAVRRLFLWKLGKLRLWPTPTAVPLCYSDGQGRAYYEIGMTGANQQAMTRAREAGRLAAGLAFRDGTLPYERFREQAAGITHCSIVLPAFLVHIWRPQEYPILDVNVWRVYCTERGLTIHPHTAPGSWADYERYTAFFRDLQASTGLNARRLDRALWVLGAGL